MPALMESGASGRRGGRLVHHTLPPSRLDGRATAITDSRSRNGTLSYSKYDTATVTTRYATARIRPSTAWDSCSDAAMALPRPARHATRCHPSCVDHRGGRDGGRGGGRGGGDHCGGGRHARERGRLGPPSPTSRREARLNCFNNLTRTHRRTRERVSWMCWTVNSRLSKCISPCRIRTRTHSLWPHV